MYSMPIKRAILCSSLVRLTATTSLKSYVFLHIKNFLLWSFEVNIL